MTKKRKFDAPKFQAAKKFAEDITGYGPNSPIWGKRLPDVLTIIETNVRQAIDDINNGGADVARRTLEGDTLTVIEELKKRLAKGAIISNQMK